MVTNQCDGCCAGLAKRGDIHVDTDGHAVMVCQADRYGVSEAPKDLRAELASVLAEIDEFLEGDFAINADPIETANIRRWRADLDRILASHGGGGEADELLRELGLDPERFRSEGGHPNAGKILAALRHPDDYAGLYLPRESRTPQPRGEGMVRCDDCHEPAGPNPICQRCAELRTESVASAMLAAAPGEGSGKVVVKCCGYCNPATGKCYTCGKDALECLHNNLRNNDTPPPASQSATMTPLEASVGPPQVFDSEAAGREIGRNSDDLSVLRYLRALHDGGREAEVLDNLIASQSAPSSNNGD